MFLFQTTEKRAAITGIFRRQEDAVAFWHRMSAEQQARNEPLEQSDFLHYPFYILEFCAPDESVWYDWCEEWEVAEHLAGISRDTLKQGECYFTIYAIKGDFQGDPNDPGADYMGALDHWRIDNEYLEHHGQDVKPWTA